MSKQNGNDKKWWQRAGYAVGGWRHGWREFRKRQMTRLFNWTRRNKTADYVVLTLEGELPEREGPPRSFIQKRLPLPDRPLSLEKWRARMQRLIDADNVHGVVIVLHDLSVGMAKLQSIRQTILNVRESGKQVIVFTNQLDNAGYYVATAADKIVVPPATTFNVFGIYNEVTFLADGLKRLGIEFDNLQISPYKSALDAVSRAEMSPEMRAQLDWLMDERYEMLTTAMAEGRAMTPEAMRGLIDGAPYKAAQMQAHGLVDVVAYEDELATLLWSADLPSAHTDDERENADTADGDQPNQTETPADAEPSPPADQPAKKAELRPWKAARKLLRRQYRRPLRDKYIGVLTVKGAMIRGESQDPPVTLPIPIIGGPLTGDRTVTQQMRAIEKDDDMAALILHVNSPGGDALAADMMWREIDRLSRQKPVVVYMGDMAASGGYYIAAAGHKIVCQPGTITGSIGVVGGRPDTSGVYDKLHLNRVHLQRGERAHLFSTAPLDADGREALWQSIIDTYDRFKQVVAQGRDLPFDGLDPICLGRVWTGRQAYDRGLVDVLGDFETAVRVAQELADLLVGDDEKMVPVVNLFPDGERNGLPKPMADVVDGVSPINWLGRVRHLRGILCLLPFVMDDRL